jgi:predicted DNA-binding transcriptional regulator YafY
VRADRLLSILLSLQARGRLTAAQLAGELEVSERTIHRDMQALSVAGVPVYAERGPGGGWVLHDSYRSGPRGLHDDELRALFLATPGTVLGDLGLDRASESALTKLLLAAPHADRARLERDGRVRVQLQFELEEDVCAFVLSFDNRVELLEPAHLRTEIARRLAAAAALYQA